MRSFTMYTAFGLGIHSQLLLPELTQADVKADAVVAFGIVELPPDIVTDSGIDFHITPQEVFFHWHDIGKFVVRSGSEIIIEPAPGIDDDVLRIFLLGTVMGTLLHQRGLIVLHASAVAIDNVVVTFIAEKGFGKSTTAAALYARGHLLVSDDMVALSMNVTGAPTVTPAFPQFKLWPEALTSLGQNANTLPRLHPEYDKRAWRLQTGFIQAPLPLGAVFVLGGGAALNIEPVAPSTALFELLRHLYVARFGSRVFKKDGSHFRQCAQLVQSVPVYHLRRNYDLTALDAIAEQVELRVRKPQLMPF